MTKEEELRGTWCATCFHNDVCMSAAEEPLPELDRPCCLMYVTRLEGEWIMVEDEDYSGGGYNMCSACNYKFSFGAYKILEHDRFCPRCGAKMKGGNVS